MPKQTSVDSWMLYRRNMKPDVPESYFSLQACKCNNNSLIKYMHIKI